MRASVVDMRYRMKEVLNALRHHETVDILYHGKLAGTIFPARASSPKKDFRDHPFFGMHAGRKQGSVENVMRKLRGGRHRAV